MKVITSISRVLVGLLFIFSGIIKSNDPKGTAIKLNEYFDVFAKDFEVTQDSLTISITDNLGTSEYLSYTFTENDSFKRIQINQSDVKSIYYEDEEVPEESDSFLGSTIFIVANNQIIYNADYILEDTSELVTLNLKIKTGLNNVILDKSLALSLNTKHEIEEILEVYPYTKKQSFWVGFFRDLRPYAIYFSIIMCILEVVLGFGILIGWKPKLITWLTLLLILFFTFLTWYSAYFNKVTDCGCFGDFIKLEPWTSFWKDVILLFFIIIIFIRRKKIIPLFSALFSWNAMAVVLIASCLFTILSNMYLPTWDFLPYKIGNNINELMTPPKGARLIDSVKSELIYEKDGKQQSFTIKNYPKTDDWKFIDTKSEVIEPAWKSKVHGFEFTSRPENNNLDIKNSLLNDDKYVILLVTTHLKKSYTDAWPKISALAHEAKANSIPFYAVTATSLEDADAFRLEHQLPFYFNNSDETLLKTMVRSNPGIMLWKKGVVVDKWSCRSIPKIKKILKIIKKNKYQ
jgi:uncharacterized membrane protein YphA (DoxX/SURF4 family)